MEKICEITGEKFLISDAEARYCKENGIPLPTISPQERLRQMLYFRNRLSLYQSKCSFTGKPMLSCIPPESDVKVFEIDIWESDKWDGTDYGMDYDFNKTFFEQFFELSRKAPWKNLALNKPLMENSDFTNGITGAKNCYLLFSCSFNEDCYYSGYLLHNKNVIDSVLTDSSELCYECINVTKGYNLKFCEHCFNCSDSLFLFECQGCSNCYGCVNLRNKKYCFYNKQLSKEEYEQKIFKINLGSFTSLQKEIKEFNEFRSKFPIKYVFGKNIENSSGNNLFNVKNCSNSFFMNFAEDMENSIWVNKCKNCFVQAMFGNNAELVYNSVTAGDNAYNIKFSVETWPDDHDLEYCMYLSYGCGNCFGCFALKRKNYCILNKQYSKEEYFDMVARIKKQMLANGEYGKFFPLSISPHYYNESEDHYFFPLSKEEAIKRGYKWAEEREAILAEQKYVIPDDIKEVKDDILSTELKCIKTGKKFKIIKQELDYLRRYNLAIPRVAPMERIKERSRALRVDRLHEEKCSSCGNKIDTVYDAKKNQILCEECYLKEVY